MHAEKNRIYIGSLDQPTYYFENDQIEKAAGVQSVALIGQELSVDEFNPIVADNPDNGLNVLLFRSSDGKVIELADGQIYAIDVTQSPEASSLIDIPDGTPAWYYHKDALVGKFYLQSVKRLARNRYQLHTVSAIGRLDKLYHGGGLFQASTFGDVLRHILAAGLHGEGEPVVEYAIDEDVAALPVSGWLKYATKRNNLYQLIFANGVNIVKNTDGSLRFTFIFTAADTAEPIDDDHIFYGGNVEYTRSYSCVSIMEHSYTAILDADPVILYDNSESGHIANEEIWFDNAPVIVSTLAATEGLTIVSATENSAVIIGSGKLTGVPYTHSTRTVSRRNIAALEDKTASVTDCTMVNAINSANLLNRLYAFYCPADYIMKIRNALIYDGYRCGKTYRFTDPHGEVVSAYLASMELNASSFSRADSEFYAGYVPAGQAGLYQHVDIITPTVDPETGETVLSGDWTVPDGVTQFKAVLISGGTGGGSGWPGKNGDDARTYTDVSETDSIEAVWYGAEGGDGGAGGSGGEPGRVRTFVIENVVPGTVYHWTLGTGGEGGAATGFIPDTVAELRAALEAEDPDAEYTDAQISAMIAQEDTNWAGSPNVGAAGTDSMFTDGSTIWSTADAESYVPTGGVYEPITDQFFALNGNTGIRGGKGGSRQISSGGTFNWVTDGEDVTGSDGTVYHGGRTGRPYTSVPELPEADLIAYGGNGAGAAVGLDRADHPHMNGGSDQSASWEVTEG